MSIQFLGTVVSMKKYYASSWSERIVWFSPMFLLPFIVILFCYQIETPLRSRICEKSFCVGNISVASSQRGNASLVPACGVVVLFSHCRFLCILKSKSVLYKNRELDFLPLSLLPIFLC